MERDDSAPCPCGTGRTLGECCGPYLAGERPAPTAEALMRSRYTAFALHDLDHVRATLHPRALADHDEESTRHWATRSEWLGLEVVSVEGGGEEDEHGVVEFVARYRPLSKREKPPITHEERAIFVREKGRWLFLDSRTPVAETITRDAPKIGRNDPCPCGSGRKHKKCCGAARADA